MSTIEEVYSGTPDHPRQKFLLHAQRRMTKDAMNLSQFITSQCFDTCIVDFTTTHLDSKEKSCLANCAQKYSGFHQRLQESVDANLVNPQGTHKILNQFDQKTEYQLPPDQQ